jgi:nitrite reductase/ring-hydroxylating ferredoxin subunit
MLDTTPRCDRRTVLRLGGAGLAVLALPSACGQADTPRPAVRDGGTADAAGDAAVDSGPSASQDSAVSQPPGDTGTHPPLDSQAPPPGDSASATDSATVTPGDTGPAIEASTGPCAPGPNILVLPLAMHPELGTTGGSVALNDPRYSDAICMAHDFYVVATGPGAFAAFSLTCTLGCCKLVIQSSMHSARCPCEGATFDLATGVATFRMAPPLPPIPVCTDGTNLYVQLA